MTDSIEDPSVPVDEGQVIIEYDVQAGTINWHGLPKPEGIYRFEQELKERNKRTGVNHE